MKIELPTAILVGILVTSLTVLVGLGKIDGHTYVELLTVGIIPALFPALLKRAPVPVPELPASERPTDPDLRVPQ